jgi:hypothetical protein
LRWELCFYSGVPGFQVLQGSTLFLVGLLPSPKVTHFKMQPSRVVLVLLCGRGSEHWVPLFPPKILTLFVWLVESWPWMVFKNFAMNFSYFITVEKHYFRGKGFSLGFAILNTFSVFLNYISVCFKWSETC